MLFRVPLSTDRFTADLVPLPQLSFQDSLGRQLDMSTVFYGALVTPTSGSLSTYLAAPKAALCVSHDTGTIAWIEEDVHPSAFQDVMAKHGLVGEDISIVELKTGEFLLPGFIDTHTVRTAPTYSDPQARVLIDIVTSSMRLKYRTWGGNCNMSVSAGVEFGLNTCVS